MSLLNIWGLLALISLIILLLIYLFKPNYQQNNVSSTYIWKLSLKYKKRSVPVSKLKNILLIIMQVLFLTGLAFMLAKPVILKKTNAHDEALLIIDASCSMRVGDTGDTRFERAVSDAKEKLEESLDSGITTSIVVASSKPYFLIEKVEQDNMDDAIELLDGLLDDYKCEYGASNLEDAIELCQDMIIENPKMKIYIYTDQTVDYVDKNIEINKVSDNDDSNIAILDAYSVIIENYYCFIVEAACYGMDLQTNVILEVNGANKTESSPDGETLEFSQTVSFYNNETIKIAFMPESIETNKLDLDEEVVVCGITDDMRIFTFVDACITVSDEDLYLFDNEFYIYGGTKEEIKVLYASPMPNNFFNGALFVIQDKYKNKFDISITEYSVVNNDKSFVDNLPYEGYDLYIYEHDMMPIKQPTDGVTLYVNPAEDVNVPNSGFYVGSEKKLNGLSISLTEEIEHELNNKIYADNITVSQYKYNVIADGFETLLSVDSKPAIMYKNEGDSKEVLWLFSLHYSNLPLLKEFPILMYNLLNYFFPTTISGNSFEVNDEVQVKSRSESITITGDNDFNVILDSFPTTLSVSYPGTYKFSQITDFGKEINEDIFVKIPKEESNIYPNMDSLSLPSVTINEEELIQDLLLYFAIAVCLFAFVEWILKGNDIA